MPMANPIHEDHLLLMADGSLSDALVALHAAGYRELAEGVQSKLRALRLVRERMTPTSANGPSVVASGGPNRSHGD